LGVKGRYRRWLGAEQGTFDVSGGLVSAIASAPYPEFSLVSFGPTADVSIGSRDMIAGTARAEMLWRRDGRAVNAFYGGVRLGSFAAIAGTATAAILVGVMIAGFLIGAGEI
jgi:hypothetical protein